MKKIFVLLIAAGLLLTNITPIYAENEESICIYVAPDGKTDGDGSIGNPFATITAADSYVEELKKSLNEETEIQVILRGGEYRIDSDISLSSSNTGFSNDKRVIYRAMDGETPVIKGSKLLDISAFSEITDEAVLSKLNENAKENIVVLDLKKQGITKLSGDFSSKIIFRSFF